MSNYDNDPKVLGSEELLSAAKVSAMRISTMYRNPEYAKAIEEIIADSISEYSHMLSGGDRGGKTGIQKWFEQELETIGKMSGPQELRTYYSRLKKKVEELDPKRVERIRDKLKGSVVSFLGEEGYDTNRLEQEIIFYIEKLDIHEERVRLKTHLDYFLQILAEPQSGGKKLGFISQEIGREINTIGSKANDAEIQKHVVSMKEELEKIKEQLNNVL